MENNLQNESSTYHEAITKIQKWWINKSAVINNKFKLIIELLKQYPSIMRQCLFQLYKISILYNPQKNENKFIYGKLIEKSLIHALDQIGLKVTDLDDNHTVGSEYKNDISLMNTNISIKGKLKKGGDVILINKKSTNKHKINIQLLLCVIQEHKLYFIPSSIVDNAVYVKEDAGCISYKSKLFTMIDKKYNEYIYTFPDLLEDEKQMLSTLKPLDIMRILFKDTILCI
jgi:hypothetical protein